MNTAVESVPKESGYRNVDSIGRVVIPKILRKKHDIEPGDCLFVYADSDGRVVMEKPDASSLSSARRK